MKPHAEPQPPEELDGEALLEWHRVIEELEAVGHLHTADRGLLTLYVQTWSANQAVAKHVAQHGPIVKFNNGVVGQSPHYKTMRETALVLATLIDKLGLSPAARKFDKKDKAEQPADLTF
jgi:P27 family predicted phage terminase small subunit